MKTIKVQSDEHNIHIDCPSCDMWEQLGVDDPRKRLNALPITEWEADEPNKNEVSHHKCLGCNTKFKVEWDYDNPMTAE